MDSPLHICNNYDDVSKTDMFIDLPFSCDDTLDLLCTMLSADLSAEYMEALL